jgi:hypothetical protein
VAINSNIINIPDSTRGITTGSGTIIELQNNSTSSILLREGQVNAYIRVLKI